MLKMALNNGSFVTVIKTVIEWFTKHLGHDESNFIEDNFSLKLI